MFSVVLSVWIKSGINDQCVSFIFCYMALCEALVRAGSSYLELLHKMEEDRMSSQVEHRMFSLLPSSSA